LQQHPNLGKWYLRKLESLKKANLFLAISEATLEDAREAISLPGHGLFNVSAACSDSFHPLAFSDAERQAILSRLRDQPAVHSLCRNDRGAQERIAMFSAYARLPAGLRQGHQIVLVGKTDDTQTAALRRWRARRGSKRSGSSLPDI
jgi:hypothetical protein